MEEIRTIQNDVDYRKLKIRGGNNADYDFSDYKTFKELFRDFYYKIITIDEADRKQDEFNGRIGVLENYTLRNNKYVGAKNKLLNNAKYFYDGREKIIEGFKEGIFLLKCDGESKQQTSKKPIKTDANAFNECINKKETGINRELFKKHFNFQRPSSMVKYLYKINNREKSNELVSSINSGLKDLKKEIKEMPEEEREIEKPDEIVEIVEEILNFNK